MEATIDNLNDMCALMCDNVVPQKGKEMEENKVNVNEIVEKFIITMNPSYWNGKGNKPKDLDMRVWQAPENTLPDDCICMTIEKENEDEGYVTFIEIVDKEDDMMNACLTCYSINSVEEIAGTLSELLRQEGLA